MRGLRAGFAKGARSLDDLGRRLSKAVRFRGFKLTRSGRVITLWGKVNPDVPLADFVLPDSGLLREDVELLVAPKDNLGVTLRKRDWDDHILDHVEAHFDQAKRMRQGKDVTTVFLGHRRSTPLCRARPQDQERPGGGEDRHAVGHRVHLGR